MKNGWTEKIEKLEAENKELLKELSNIVKADWKTWGDGLASADQFVSWAKSRARAVIARCEK